jgi:hypothetical protein
MSTQNLKYNLKMIATETQKSNAPDRHSLALPDSDSEITKNKRFFTTILISRFSVSMSERCILRLKNMKRAKDFFLHFFFRSETLK